MSKHKFTGPIKTKSGKEYVLCELCHSYYLNDIFINEANDCCENEILLKKIVIKSITHKWIKKLCTGDLIKFDCEICGIPGVKFELDDYILLYLDQLYTCNEYLMIRANE